MSASAVTEDVEDDVEFVSEGPLRPVLEYIDLLSDGEDDGVHTIEEQVDRQRAHAVSTLDRLAQQVAVEKQERAEKCKAFKEKMNSLQAQGRHELSVSRSSSDSGDAKRCVDIWLKMPGLKPGSINSGSLWRRRSAPAAASVNPQTCPVINCGRVYDNIPLLEGHLKRFDHSPCDPTITQKGSPPSICACVACGRHFHDQESWKEHVKSMLSSGGHRADLSCQMIVCFACPTCYCLFNSTDQCYQHMSAQKHHSQSIALFEEKPSPVPVPRYARNRLIALCKDVSFSVRCTVCSRVLASHMEATAHFNVHCRNGSAIATADRSIADTMRKLMAVGHCNSCPEAFLSLDEMEEHKQREKHEVTRVGWVEQALLYYCNHRETRAGQKSSARAGSSARPLAKRKRLCPDATAEKHPALAWFCECGLRFSEEDKALKHLQNANQIFHKCAVCGKLMGESSIARLHMSRFHGGAHLSNFIFHCRRCKVEMPRLQDIMAHIGTSHSGHSFYQEREDQVASNDVQEGQEVASDVVASPKPSTSAGLEAQESVPPPPPSSSWICRMCEDLFDSEASVRKHCADLSSHSFQRFACAQCPQKFFKESTLRRHCAHEHAGKLLVRFFCGLCDSMQFESEVEFMEHYCSLHSHDYYSLEQNNTAESTPCPCMSSGTSRQERKPIFTRCMKQLAAENKCRYCCRQCDKHTPAYAEMKTHILLKHPSPGEKSFSVLCCVCSQSHEDVPSFHSHYHKHHCRAEPCATSCHGPAVIDADELCPEKNAEEFEDVKKAMSSSAEEDVKKEVTVSQDLKDDEKFDQDVKLALALSLEEEKKMVDMNKELEEALKRSLEEF